MWDEEAGLKTMPLLCSSSWEVRWGREQRDGVREGGTNRHTGICSTVVRVGKGSSIGRLFMLWEEGAPTNQQSHTGGAEQEVLLTGLGFLAHSTGQSRFPDMDWWSEKVRRTSGHY